MLELCSACLCAPSNVQLRVGKYEHLAPPNPYISETASHRFQKVSHTSPYVVTCLHIRAKLVKSPKKWRNAQSWHILKEAWHILNEAKRYANGTCTPNHITSDLLRSTRPRASTLGILEACLFGYATVSFYFMWGFFCLLSFTIRDYQDLSHKFAGSPDYRNIAGGEGGRGLKK